MAYRITAFEEGGPRRCSLAEFLELTDEKREVVSFVGAGGKTTNLFRLARELAGRKPDGSRRRILISTTTKMRLPDTGCVLLSPSLSRIERALSEEPYVVVGTARPPKMEGLEPALFDRAVLLADVTLLEADGAKGLPVKAPAAHEPVILPRTGKVAALLGLDGIGERIRSACHRPERVCEGLDAAPGHRLTCEDAAILISEEWGLRKGVGDRGFYVILNQAEGSQGLFKAARIAGELARRGCIHTAAAGRGEEESP